MVWELTSINHTDAFDTYFKKVQTIVSFFTLSDNIILNPQRLHSKTNRCGWKGPVTQVLHPNLVWTPTPPPRSKKMFLLKVPSLYEIVPVSWDLCFHPIYSNDHSVLLCQYQAAQKQLLCQYVPWTHNQMILVAVGEKSVSPFLFYPIIFERVYYRLEELHTIGNNSDIISLLLNINFKSSNIYFGRPEIKNVVGDTWSDLMILV